MGIPHGANGVDSKDKSFSMNLLHNIKAIYHKNFLCSPKFCKTLKIGNAWMGNPLIIALSYGKLLRPLGRAKTWSDFKHFFC